MSPGFTARRAVLTLPEYFDHQGTATVTMSVSLDAIRWRPIVADQPPGVLDAVGEIKLPDSKVVIGLLFRRAWVLAVANSGYIVGWRQVAAERGRIQADLFSQAGRRRGRDALTAGLCRADHAVEQERREACKPQGKNRGRNQDLQQAEAGVSKFGSANPGAKMTLACWM